MATLTALRGTRDLTPGEIERWHAMEETARRVLSAAAFSEIRTPVFERTELFERGVGEATDIVSKEMYSFQSRSGDRITLRPECTAGVVRAYLERGLRTKHPSPLRLWYLGPMFRYERPQKGRQRQFHQVGVEVLDTLDPRADAEVIVVACEYLRALGLDDLAVDVNSLGDRQDRQRYREALVAYLRSVEDRLDQDSRARIDRNPLRVLDSKDEGTQAALAGAPSVLDHLGDETRAHFEEVCAHLDATGTRYRVTPSLVRGLDYYTRTTFEIRSDKLGAQSAVCGGGRYDDLVEELGGPPVPAVGWALGLERLAIILDEVHGPLEIAGPDAYVISRGTEAERAALPLARDLRRAGIRCELSLARSAFGKQLAAADRRHARFALVLGEDEMKSGKVTVKNLADGEQREVSRDEIAGYLTGAAAAREAAT